MVGIGCSAVWKFFEKYDGGGRCLLGCTGKKQFVRRSDSSTKVFWSHILHNHPDLHQELKSNPISSQPVVRVPVKRAARLMEVTRQPIDEEKPLRSGREESSSMQYSRDTMDNDHLWSMIAPNVANFQMEEFNVKSMVRVAVVQSGTVIYDLKATLEKVRQITKNAADQNAELVLFPEAFIGGYLKGLDFGIRMGSRTNEGREEFQRYYQNAIEYHSEEAEQLASIASENGVYLVVGVVERDGGTLYCSVFYYGPNGDRLGKHRKLMPTAMERCVWGFGDGSTINVHPTKIGKIGAAICWENYMPLLRTSMYQEGIQLYLAPTVDDRDVWLPTMQTIALEGRCFVISSCQFLKSTDFPSDHPAYDSSGKILIKGGSCVISPLGEVLVKPVFNEDALHVIDLDLGQIARGKFDLDSVGHYSRPEVFQLIVNRTAY